MSPWRSVLTVILALVCFIAGVYGASSYVNKQIARNSHQLCGIINIEVNTLTSLREKNPHIEPLYTDFKQLQEEYKC